ncbi:hypothetical protein C8J57DRAFT_1430659 [Mycena rebaudengoi]|nr:hypothetical protein C8J57DRAFT_1430659 [Mycena rebaudengoi]
MSTSAARPVRKVQNRDMNAGSAANYAVLSDITSKLAASKKFTPTTKVEKACFALLDDLDHVGNHVPGSLTSKETCAMKYGLLQLSKVPPSWFITFSSVDNNHPLCLYYADNEIKFSLRIRSSDERMRLISQNPVAAARFFNFMTKSFIKNVLGVGTGTRGLYSETDAYYGTVEQQGV